MKLRVEVDGEVYFLARQPSGAWSTQSENRQASAQALPGDYSIEFEGTELRFHEGASGTASIVEAMPGVFSVLVGDRSFRVHVAPGAGADFEVWPNAGESRAISLTDARDRSNRLAKNSTNGPVEVRAQMPGKVIKVLVAPGATVEAGQGLIVVEAMKMQNEMKAPKDGKIARVHAKEGTTVAAGEPLVVVE